MPEFIVNKVHHYQDGLSLAKKSTGQNTVFEHVIRRRTGLDIRKSKVKQYTFRISFEHFTNAKVVYFNAMKSHSLGYSHAATNRTRIGRTVNFICTQYLKRLLGRLPEHKEAIYYSLEPAK